MGVILLVALLLVLPLLAACAGEAKWVDPQNEPPPNRFLADSSWLMCHRNAYCQASSPYPGLTGPPASEEEDFLPGRVGTITANFSSRYPDGGRIIWASCYGRVIKIDPEGDKLRYIDMIESEPVQWAPDDIVSEIWATMSCRELADLLARVLPPERKLREGELGPGASGVYPVLGSDGIFYQGLGRKIIAYGDQVEGKRLSPIEVKRVYKIPEDLLPREWDKICGLVMTYDGMLAFATSCGLVGIVDRGFEKAHYLLLGEGSEYNYNSIAADEDGGIYVVTHKHMYRVQWTGEKLTIDEDEGGWSAEYGTGHPTSLKVQTQAGSGSTPTLMGTSDQDKFVVITDGEELMNIVLFWRDKIPDDWEQIPGTNDRRVAAQVPITFGDPSRKRSFSDQSVLVRGYGAFVVNNEFQKYEETTVLNTLLSGETDHAPYGCEKFEWDPEARQLRSVWANQEVSFPNAIPTMSSATNLIYSIGQRNGVWTLEAVDWDTGASAFYYELGDRARHNSAFAACQVGPDGCIYYGTFLGMTRIWP